MKQIYRAWKKGILSILTGAVIVSLFCGMQLYDVQKNTLAWWGSIYPEFCFSEISEDDVNEKFVPEQKPKISFWLAKALERW